MHAEKEHKTQLNLIREKSSFKAIGLGVCFREEGAV